MTWVSGRLIGRCVHILCNLANSVKLNELIFLRMQATRFRCAAFPTTFLWSSPRYAMAIEIQNGRLGLVLKL